MKLFSRLRTQSGDRGPDAESSGIAFRYTGQGLDVGGYYLEAALTLRLESTCNQNRCVWRQQRFHFGVQAREYNRLHGAGQVFEFKHGHELALLCAARAAFGDKAGHFTVSVIAVRDELGQCLGGELCKFCGKPVQRMPRNVVAQGFFLKRKKLIERPLRGVRGRRFRDRGSLEKIGEEAALSAVAVSLEFLPMLDCGIRYSHELGPLPAKRVQRAAPDQTLQHALVHRAGIDFLAKMEEAAKA